MNERTRTQRDAQVAHEVAARAIRRLDILEWVIIAGAMALAIGGGAAVAWLIAPTVDYGFRSIWMVMSMVLFVVPGVIGLMRMRRDERAARTKTPSNPEEDDG